MNWEKSDRLHLFSVMLLFVKLLLQIYYPNEKSVFLDITGFFIYKIGIKESKNKY